MSPAIAVIGTWILMTGWTMLLGSWQVSVPTIRQPDHHGLRKRTAVLHFQTRFRKGFARTRRDADVTNSEHLHGSFRRRARIRKPFDPCSVDKG